MYVEVKETKKLHFHFCCQKEGISRFEKIILNRSYLLHDFTRLKDYYSVDFMEVFSCCCTGICSNCRLYFIGKWLTDANVQSNFIT